jgi:hypothetical protein
MQNAPDLDIRGELTEISQELYLIANDLVETNQRLHVLISRIPKKEQPQSQDETNSQSPEK